MKLQSLISRTALLGSLCAALATNLAWAGGSGGGGGGSGGGSGGTTSSRLTEMPGEVLVKLRSSAALPAVLGRYPVTLVSRFGSRPIYRLKVVGSTRLKDVLAAMALDTDIMIAENNPTHMAPEVGRNVVWTIGTPQAYAAQWAPKAMRLAEAQQLSRGAGVTVAVLDTGVDRSHPALASRLLPGFDFVDFDTDPSEVPAAGSVAYGHGTHVAGLVAMVAPQARILPLRVLDAKGEGNAWVLAEAMLYAADPDGNPATADGVQVINLSLGSFARTRIMDTIAQIVSCAAAIPDDPIGDRSDPGYNDDSVRCSGSSGAVVVAAAGNDSSSTRVYPAAENAYGLVAVGASNADGKLASFSNLGSWVTMAAPGEGITSTVPGGGYATWSGTSMASPLAAGAAALLRAYNPALPPKDVARRIERSGAALCGTPLLQLDLVASLTNRQAAAICR